MYIVHVLSPWVRRTTVTPPINTAAARQITTTNFNTKEKTVGERPIRKSTFESVALRKELEKQYAMT